MADLKESEITVLSTIDGSAEKCLLLTPLGAENAPLVVGLHTWSHDRFNQLEQMKPYCAQRGWSLLLPEFRGPNLVSNSRATEACASEVAIQDVLDAVRHVGREPGFDQSALFLLGGSGGGHMALMLAARAPKLWTGVSSWVPITDLAAWHDENPHYAHHVEACCGGAPGASPEVARQYAARSPMSYLPQLAEATLSVHHGRFDPVVAYSHSWRLAVELERARAANFFFEIFSGGHDIHYHTAFSWFETLHGALAPDDEHLTG